MKYIAIQNINVTLNLTKLNKYKNVSCTINTVGVSHSYKLFLNFTANNLVLPIITDNNYLLLSFSDTVRPQKRANAMIFLIYKDTRSACKMGLILELLQNNENEHA